MNRPRYKKDDILKAIHNSGGIVSAIAKRLGCDWHTCKRAIERYPATQEAVQSERENLLDLAEVKLIEAIRAGELPAIKFYLATQGKHRGYSERQEVTGADAAPIKITEIQICRPEPLALPETGIDSGVGSE